MLPKCLRLKQQHKAWQNQARQYDNNAVQIWGFLGFTIVPRTFKGTGAVARQGLFVTHRMQPCVYMLCVVDMNLNETKGVVVRKVQMFHILLPTDDKGAVLP